MSPVHHLNSQREHDFARSARLLWVGITTVLLFATEVTASESLFEDEIWPIFQERCIACHEAGNAEGQLRLDARQAFLQGGVSGVEIGRAHV